MKHLILILVQVVLFLGISKAQQVVLWTINGDSIVAREVSTFDNPETKEVKYLTFKRNWASIERGDIFSIKLADNTQHIVYQTLYEGERSVEQMKLYVDGHRFGYKHSRKGAFLIGFAGGLTAMALSPDRLFVAPIVPLATVICVGRFSPIHPSPINEHHFVEGYRHRRKARNVNGSVMGSIAGLVVGVAGSFLIHGWGY